jgi:hypothetical protein
MIFTYRKKIKCTFKRKVIYHLPGNTEYFYAHEEEDEDEAEEI